MFNVHLERSPIVMRLYLMPSLDPHLSFHTHCCNLQAHHSLSVELNSYARASPQETV